VSKFSGFKKNLNEMMSTPLTVNSPKPTLDKNKLLIFVLLGSGALGMGIVISCLWLFSGPSDSDGKTTILDVQSSAPQESGALVIHFNDKATSDSTGRMGTEGTRVRASSGTLVRVRLLNSLETFDSVPVFAQLIDHSLGAKFYGWTLLGEAVSDANVDRIQMSFKMLRSPQGRSTEGIIGTALSLDGTMGIRASKVEGLLNRSLLGSANGAGLSGQVKGSKDLSSLLLRAIFTGLQSETSKDLSAIYNRGSALSLKPGEEFFIQLTENF